MNARHFRFLAAIAFAVPLLVSAQANYDYDTEPLPYRDAPWDRPTSVAVSTLTELGILQGHPDGTFRARDLVNRAEFVKTMMGFLPDLQAQSGLDCFPDFGATEWYAPAVCGAKELGIVRGNVMPDLPPGQWPFEPARPVNYVEALKVLTEVFAIPTSPLPSGQEWYVPYLEKARALRVDLPNLEPGTELTRGEIARLAVAFFAESRGELELLRQIERGIPNSSSSSRSSVSSRSSSVSSVRSSSSRSSVRSSSSRSSSVSSTSDVLSTRPTFLRLGTVSSAVLGAVNIFNNTEPFVIRDITITMENAVASLDRLDLYGSGGQLIGRATLSGTNNTQYLLHLPSGSFVVPRRENRSLFVRPALRSFTGGGVSGEIVQIASFTIQGTGGWSNSTYSTTTSEIFPIFQTSRSTISGITNALTASTTLLAGPDQMLGAFRFEGTRGDGSAQLSVTDLAFTIGATGGVTVSDLKLGAEGTSRTVACSLVGSLATCAAIPSELGSFDTEARTLRLMGDVTIPSGAQSATLQVSLNNPGSTTSAGAVRWTDGTSNFSWVPFDTPIVQGTVHRM